MKRIFLFLLLLAGIGFACEKNDSEILDQAQIVESRKQDLATNLVSLIQGNSQLNADDLHKLKAFKHSNPEVNALPGDLLEMSTDGQEWLGLVETIAQQIRELSALVPKAELDQFISDSLRDTGERVIRNPCKTIYNNAVLEAQLEYIACVNLTGINCFDTYYSTLITALDDYYDCMGQ
jgi:hypothetical protein